MASVTLLWAKQQRGSIDGFLPQNMRDGLGQLMRNDLVGTEFAGLTTLASEVAVQTAAELRVVPHRLEDCLAERPLEVRAARRGVTAAAADWAGLGEPRDQPTVGGKLTGVWKAGARTDFVDDRHR
jgi:hypothetical protein